MNVALLGAGGSGFIRTDVGQHNDCIEEAWKMRAEKCKYVLVFINHELGTSSMFFSFYFSGVKSINPDYRNPRSIASKVELFKNEGNANEKVWKRKNRKLFRTNFRLRDGLLLVDGGSGRSVVSGRHVVEALNGSRARCRHLSLKGRRNRKVSWVEKFLVENKWIQSSRAADSNSSSINQAFNWIIS